MSDGVIEGGSEGVRKCGSVEVWKVGRKSQREGVSKGMRE